jgi:hypothetical protein
METAPARGLLHMTTFNPGTLPEDLHPLIGSILGCLREIMDKQEFVQPVWFMVDRRNEQMMPILIPFEDAADKQIAAQLVRKLVLIQQPQVDAIVFMCEAWKKELNKDHPEFDHRKTPVRDMQGREDIVMIMVETYDGVWIAEPVVTGEPGMERKLATIDFELQPNYAGTMTNYLPPRGKPN